MLCVSAWKKGVVWCRDRLFHQQRLSFWYQERCFKNGVPHMCRWPVELRLGCALVRWNESSECYGKWSRSADCFLLGASLHCAVLPAMPLQCNRYDSFIVSICGKIGSTVPPICCEKLSQTGLQSAGVSFVVIVGISSEIRPNVLFTVLH